jgi:NifU-like protein involved in Fe-S cluster formation
MDFDRFKMINDEMRNVGVMEAPSTVRSFKNEACGDDYAIYLRIEEGVIVDASFTTTGCGFGLVALALATEWIKGKTLEQAETLREDDVEAGIDGFPERRREYPRKAVEIVLATIRDYRDDGKNGRRIKSKGKGD